MKVGCTDITIGVFYNVLWIAIPVLGIDVSMYALYFSSSLIVPCDFSLSILYYPHMYVPIDARGLYAKWFPVSCFYKF